MTGSAAGDRAASRPTSPVPTGPRWPVRLTTHLWNPNGTAGRALLVHDLGADGTGWWQVASHLADRGYLVAAPDLRSHGRSPTAVDHRLATLAEDVAGLGTGWDVVVGHGIGGAIVGHLLARRDVDAASALLVDPVLVFAADRREALRSRLHAEVGHLDAAQVAAAHPRWAATDVTRTVLAAAACGPDVVDRVVDHNPDWDLSPQRAAWHTRVHLLAADATEGALLATSTAVRFTDGGGVTTGVVAGAGHAIHRDDPAAVVAALEELLVSRS